MQVVQSKPVMQYSQTNGSLIKTGSGKKIVVEQDDGEDEEIEETETIIKKTIIRKKGKKTYVRFEKFILKYIREMVGKLCHCHGQRLLLHIASSFRRVRKIPKSSIVFHGYVLEEKALVKLDRGEISLHKSKVLNVIQCNKSGVII